MSFIGEVTNAFGRLASYPNKAWVDGFEGRQLAAAANEKKIDHEKHEKHEGG